MKSCLLLGWHWNRRQHPPLCTPQQQNKARA